ncbi:uncharacterized protein LOC130677763 [Microplitis mediator]|uniref:uncharacterized protein LOC130677763 n=1 Tax=Microplitis mediator TaxID=375433 RepID=UPI0025567E02|nr:uncharacterized protein LOC130677763 [Microplitis mediator]
MELSTDSTGAEGFYLPHHAVVKESSSTTKLRIVFSGSAKSSSGISLNDTLLTGATLQKPIFIHLIRFRLHPIILIGDLEKMFRYVWVRPEDHTFGTTSATFLAVRSLVQVAEDERSNFPEAADIIKEQFYVDDLIAGTDTVNKAIKIRNDLTELLKRGGFNIRQWASNNSEVLKGIPEEHINKKLQIEVDPMLKTLGIHWQTQSDDLTYTFNKLPINNAGVKKLLGTKNFQLIQNAWTSYASEFNSINQVLYNRPLVLLDTCDIQIHGFADASEKAYGACIYLRRTASSGDVRTNLLCAKTKVAPLQTQTLARLELCAALMLANLYDTIKELLPTQLSRVIFWSDSTIALHWIKTPPYQLKTFVANRVSQIQEKTPITSWRHIKSKDNPADASSRGLTPKEFYPENDWFISIISTPIEDNERKKLTCLTTCVKTSSLDDSFIKFFSSASNLHRAIARILRLSKNNKYTGEYTLEELRQSQVKIIKLIQNIHFTKDIHNLKHKKEIHENSKLKHLSPFFDDYDIIRVGGRLNHANISYNQKHPIILPQSHPYTTLIIQEAHQRHFHAGPQTTLYVVRRNFWPLNGRNEVKRVTYRCVRCRKSNPQTAIYPMGQLPKERVTQTRPFHHTGVDYCGPFYIKEKKHRNRGRVKVYVAVFVCLAVKATHFEVVSDLTSEGFIAALRRFISRRDKCYSIHSDNGTNFVGANNQLKEIYQQINSEEHQQKVHRYLTEEGIQWKFIPARSPNFGGLWEAAVKSFKGHLMRIVGDTLLTFEELNTFVIEIKAILNSRPLTPSSSDPNDPIAITPGHFLIGDSITSLPDWDWADTASNKLSSWQLIQKLRQAFWKRWHKEYINGLNVRQK